MAHSGSGGSSHGAAGPVFETTVSQPNRATAKIVAPATPLARLGSLRGGHFGGRSGAWGTSGLEDGACWTTGGTGGAGVRPVDVDGVASAAAAGEARV